MARGRVISICNIFDFEFGKKNLLYFNKKSKSSTLLPNTKVVEPNTLGLISLRKLHSMLIIMQLKGSSNRISNGELVEKKIF
jgi:hypothetical protein